MSSFQVGAIIGSIITGVIIGAIPAVCGAKKGKTKFAVIGFFACLISSIISGMILAIPVCAIFTFLIFKTAKGKENEKNIKRKEN